MTALASRKSSGPRFLLRLGFHLRRLHLATLLPQTGLPDPRKPLQLHNPFPQLLTRPVRFTKPDRLILKPVREAPGPPGSSEEDVYVLPYEPPRFVSMQLAQSRRRHRQLARAAVRELEQIDSAAVGYEEFAGADRHRGGGIGDESAGGADPPLLP
ncbi:hypothetical protein SASPL_109613 [Salvia splendens]|uniref:Uncharacterized protein n=1 Tax=Salvia splendens TaxID=180675 RepID=A0A8X9A9D0_SALSN|nr:hypothetical protein SASPL_109613 [Salvia splendens]